MILLLDHHDSFVHSLARYVAELGGSPRVVRVDTLDVDDVLRLSPRRIILSPGPCTPRECPLALDVIRRCGPTTPILGVCLGHQCIGAAYGARVVRADQPRHGMTSTISHEGRDVFANLPHRFEATRYHSLVVSPVDFPADLDITARADDGAIMGIRHRIHRVSGVQFHPESVLTEHGHALLGNFLREESGQGI